MNDELERCEEITVKSGKQGSIYIMRSVQNPANKYVMKVSRDHDYLIQHEYIVGAALNNLAEYCPHFIRTYGKITTTSQKLKKSDYEDVQIEKQARYETLEQDALLLEYLPRCHKLFSYICSANIHENILFSLIKQVLLATRHGQDACKMTHYDLHSRNVLVTPCDPNLVLLYQFEDDFYAVPTYGYLAKIIDYGFAYVDAMENKHMYSSLCFTESGFMCDRFEPLSDPKLFLLTVSSELHEFRDTRKCRYLRKLIVSLFEPLNVDPDSGWDKDFETAAVEVVIDGLGRDEDYGSRIYSKYGFQVLDTICTLISLPLKEYKSTHMTEEFMQFMEQWVKIENQISQSRYKLYIMRKIMDFARDIKTKYHNRLQKHQAVKQFKTKLTEVIDQVSKYCIIRHVNFDSMLEGLYKFAKSMEGMLHDIMNRQMAAKAQRTSLMKYQSVGEIVDYLDNVLNDESYEYSNETLFQLVTSYDFANKKVSLPEIAGNVDASTVQHEFYHKFTIDSYQQLGGASAVE